MHPSCSCERSPPVFVLGRFCSRGRWLTSARRPWPFVLLTAALYKAECVLVESLGVCLNSCLWARVKHGCVGNRFTSLDDPSVGIPAASRRPWPLKRWERDVWKKRHKRRVFVLLLSERLGTDRHVESGCNDDEREPVCLESKICRNKTAGWNEAASAFGTCV